MGSGAASSALGSAAGAGAAGAASGAAGSAAGSSLASGLAAAGGSGGGGGGWLGTGLFKNDQYNPAPNNTNPAQGQVASQAAMPHHKVPSTPIALQMLQNLPMSTLSAV